jgi:hypothetical protein
MITMRRGTLLALLLLLAAVAIPATPGVAQTSQLAAAQQAAEVRADFNQDSFADLAIGAPGEAIGSFSEAGAVTVMYGTGCAALAASCSRRSGVPSSAATALAGRWRSGTSTTTASLT